MCAEHPLAWITFVNFWPLCCVIVIAVAYPLWRALQARERELDASRLVALGCLLTCGLIGWLRWSDVLC